MVRLPGGTMHLPYQPPTEASLATKSWKLNLKFLPSWPSLPLHNVIPAKAGISTLNATRQNTKKTSPHLILET
jgi:hypothetical protein